MQVQGPLTHCNKSNKERISVDAREFVGFVARKYGSCHLMLSISSLKKEVKCWKKDVRRVAEV